MNLIKFLYLHDAWQNFIGCWREDNRGGAEELSKFVCDKKRDKEAILKAFPWNINNSKKGYWSKINGEWLKTFKDEEESPQSFNPDLAEHKEIYGNKDVRFEWALQEGLEAGTEVRYSVPF